MTTKEKLLCLVNDVLNSYVRMLHEEGAIDRKTFDELTDVDTSVIHRRRGEIAIRCVDGWLPQIESPAGDSNGR